MDCIFPWSHQSCDPLSSLERSKELELAIGRLMSTTQAHRPLSSVFPTHTTQPDSYSTRRRRNSDEGVTFRPPSTDEKKKVRTTCE